MIHPYSKDQILKIIQQRLSVLGYDIFEPRALEFCARKVAVAFGDMRSALSVCRSAIEVFEEELGHATNKEYLNIGLMNVGRSKEVKHKCVTLQIDGSVVRFTLKVLIHASHFYEPIHFSYQLYFHFFHHSSITTRNPALQQFSLGGRWRRLKSSHVYINISNNKMIRNYRVRCKTHKVMFVCSYIWLVLFLRPLTKAESRYDGLMASQAKGPMPKRRPCIEDKVSLRVG